jgi:hypothetical protein
VIYLEELAPMRGTVAAGKNIWLFWCGGNCHDGGMKNGISGVVGLAALLAGCGSKSETESQVDSRPGKEKADAQSRQRPELALTALNKSAWRGEAKPTHEESIAAIEKLGGRFRDDGKELYLRGTKITDAGVEKLQAALPKCDIYH